MTVKIEEDKYICDICGFVGNGRKMYAWFSPTQLKNSPKFNTNRSGEVCKRCLTKLDEIENKVPFIDTYKLYKEYPDLFRLYILTGK